MTEGMNQILSAAIASSVITFVLTVIYWEYRMRKVKKLPSEIVSGTNASNDTERMLEWIRTRLHACRGLIRTDKCIRHYGSTYGFEHVVAKGPEQTYWMRVLLRTVNLAGCELIIRVAAKRDKKIISYKSLEAERNKFIRVYGHLKNRYTTYY